MTPPQLADRLGVGRGTINNWESGDSVPSILWLGPLCDALGVDANLFAVLPPIPASPVDEFLVDHEERELSREEVEALRSVAAVDTERPKPTGGGARGVVARRDTARD
jgi:transcriptional regulator with XRE-family HTH domain